MWGWTVVRTFSDDRGDYCVKVQMERAAFYCTTKRYPYKEMASFPRRVALRAHDNDHLLAIFFGDVPEMGNAYVFRPEIVVDDGIPNRDDRSPKKQKTWLDIPLDRGVLLGDYVSGRADV
jgi:hypothetical protein